MRISYLLFLLLSACASAGDNLECVTQADCASGASCINNRCVRDTGSDSGGQPDTAPDTSSSDTEPQDTEPADTTVADTAPDTEPADTTPDTAPDGADDTAPSDADTTPACGAFDATCSRASDCCSGFCVPNGIGATTGFCTDSCNSYADCNPTGRRGDFSCLPVDDGGALRRVCLPSDFGTRCDASTDCLGGICLRTAAASSCSWECRSGADCPDGTACGLLDFGGGDLRYTCAPIGGGCLTQNDCLSQTCLTPDTGGIGYCSLFCRAGGDDCPATWSCSAVDPTLPDLSVCALP